jgi:hypothetical protein
MAEKKKSWSKIIGKLKRFLNEVGPLWPDSTKLSGLGKNGPYHCENCEYLKGVEVGKMFKDEKGRARCNHSVVIADSEVEHDEKGLAIIDNPKTWCCEFVEPVKEKKD